MNRRIKSGIGIFNYNLDMIWELPKELNLLGKIVLFPVCVVFGIMVVSVSFLIGVLHALFSDEKGIDLFID